VAVAKQNTLAKPHDTMMPPPPSELMSIQARKIQESTSLPRAFLCLLLAHRWTATPWSRWAFGWDRELTCQRCGQIRHERTKLHANLRYEDDR
jgi:hypothetical protein